MTIQKSVLFGLTFLTLIPAATAQCRRSLTPAFSAAAPLQHVTRFQKFSTDHQQISVRRKVYVSQPPVAGTSCQTGQCRRLSELAGRLETLLHEACLDLYYNYGHELQFKTTYGDVYRLFQIARQLQATQGISEHALLQQQLTEADGLLHHIQNTVSSMSAARRRRVGVDDMGARLQQVEIVLHQILEDTGVAVNSGLEEPPAPDSLSNVQEPSLAPAQPLTLAPEPPVAPPAPATPGLPLNSPPADEVSFAPEAPAAAGVN